MYGDKTVSVLDRDIEILMDDYERVCALESIGVSVYNPAIHQIRKRWGIELNSVGREYRMEDRSNPKFDRTHHDKLVAVSKKLLGRMVHWMDARLDDIKGKINEVTGKNARLSEELDKIHKVIAMLPDELPEEKLPIEKWMSKISVEDKVDFKACIEWAKNPTVLDDAIKSYTVYTTLTDDASKRENGKFDFSKLGKSSSWAAKRASGILGFSPFNSGSEAWSLPGNVILVSRKNSASFAVARDLEKEDGEIERLSKEQIKEALSAVNDILAHLRERQTKRGVFSYTGIYEKIEEMKKTKEDEVDRKAMIRATKRIKNALAVEDAITTSLVRVAEGLMKYIRASIK